MNGIRRMGSILMFVSLMADWNFAQQVPSGNATGLNSQPIAEDGNLPTSLAPQNNAPRQTPGIGAALSLKDAEALAIRSNPQITVARLNALASQQVTREVRSNLWPSAVADITAVDANPGSRITAGSLNNPVIYQRAAAGATVSQLITDFGHTTNLIASANLSAKAEEQNALATREQILLAVDQAFYSALQARDLLRVAAQTVSDRQTVSEQIQALFNSKLKSQLDLSFANVNLSQARLLLLDSKNNENAALATLSMVLGYPNMQNFQLVPDTTPIAQPPGNVDDLILQAFAERPEILSLNFQYQSAQKFQAAQRDQLLPSIRAVGTVGDTPVRNPVISSWYGAVGVNVEIPLFNGFLYNARSREATLREQAIQERLFNLRNTIARDVRISWLNANTAYQRVDVTRQLLSQANLALDLSQTRYKLGLGSIVELSQAQLQQTQAEISSAQAIYEYRLSLAVVRYETTGI